MGGRGEIPDEQGEQEASERAATVTFGEAVYNDGGEALGTIRGVKEGGFFVTTRESVEALSVEHARWDHDFGEAELMWRCTECGEKGEIGRTSRTPAELRGGEGSPHVLDGGLTRRGPTRRPPLRSSSRSLTTGYCRRFSRSRRSRS